MSSSQLRREPTAQEARYLLRRTPSFMAMGGNAKGAKPGGLRALERDETSKGSTLVLGLRQADG